MHNVITSIAVALYSFIFTTAPSGNFDILQSKQIEPAAVTVVEDKFELTNKEIELIALITMAEAEGESEYGKRLVIDTILNRKDSLYFPDTVYDVIYQPYQFTSTSNGRMERCEVRTDICNLVKDELKQRTDYNVIFFRTGRYSSYGEPLFKEGNHYFSASERS